MGQATDSTRTSVQVTPPQQVTARTLAQLERQVDDAIAGRASAVEILCSGVQVVDSAGLNWLITAQSRLEQAGIGLKLVEPSGILGDVLMATRLESRFVIEGPGRSGGAVNA